MTLLRGITWEHERGFGSVVASARAYESAQPDVAIDWEYRSLQAFADQPIESLVRDFDLLVIDHPHVPEAAQKGLLFPLDGAGHDKELFLLATQSVGKSHASYQSGGHQYALALDAAAQVAAFRPDLLEAPPATWAEVLDLARKGKVVWPAKPIDAFASLVTLAGNSGTPPMSGETFLPLKGMLEALDYLTELAQLVPPESLDWNPIQAADALSGSDQWTYCPLLYGYSNYARPEYRRRRLAFTDIPSGRNGVRGSMLGGTGIAVSALSSNLADAVAHAFWLASSDVQSGVYYEGGGQPANSVAWEDERLNEHSLNFFRNTRKTLEGAYVRPRWPSFIAFQDLASLLVHDAIRGRMTVIELSERLDALTERHGRKQ